MRKAIKRVAICLVAALLFWSGTLIADKQTLRQELVRLHVVGASDTEADQAMKLRLKDAVVDSLKTDMENMHNAEEAKAYLQENLPKIEAFANRFLQEAGSRDTVKVQLGAEEFPARVYDTFTLPAGVYEALRITIGEGEGKNWWCVAFPSLCLPATTDGFEAVASGAGFSNALTGAIEGKSGYEVRFWVLDALGRIENFLHRA